MVNFASININGLRDVDKFRQLCAYCEENHFDIVALQETFWDDKFFQDHKNIWSGKILTSYGENARQGVAFLIKNKFRDNVSIVSQFSGRFLHVHLVDCDKEFDLINMYFPNSVEDRAKFCLNIQKNIPKSENLLWFGDFNTSLSPLDRGFNSRHSEDRAFKALDSLLSEFNTYDVWRARNPSARIFSWRRVVQNTLLQSRIDYIFITKNISPFVKNVYYKHNTFSDHSCVVLNVDFSQVERGPGLWIFNNSLLDDEVFVEKIDEIIQKEKLCPLFEREILVWIDNLKYKIKKFSQIYAKNKKKKERAEYFKLQKEFEKLSYCAANSLMFDVDKFEKIKLDLKNYEQKLCNGAILRSKAQWAIDGDKNTKYFLQLEKSRQENNSIKQLKNKDGKILNNSDEILEEIYSFYKELFSCTIVNDEKMHEISSFISSKVSDEQKQYLDSEIRAEEIFKALHEMSKNKSPGGDGITVSFYCKFYHHFGDILKKVFDEIEKEKLMPRSMRHGIITLIYKNKGDKNLLRNF